NLAWPMIAFGWVTNLLQQGMASWKRMLKVMDTEPAVKDEGACLDEAAPGVGAAKAGVIRGAIEIRHLSFAFGDREVLSDVLFSDTLAANVALGVPDAVVRQPERIRAAGVVAQLDKDVADFPKDYETMVGERGITLSGGQKQRAAIARAVVVDPRILILDDALSAVDTYTEEEILSRLRGVMRARTSIIISHRISTVRD